MNDYYYKGMWCIYSPHPALNGRYEISIEMDNTGINFLGRFDTQKECRTAINAYLKSKNIKKYVNEEFC